MSVRREQHFQYKLASSCIVKAKPLLLRKNQVTFLFYYNFIEQCVEKRLFVYVGAEDEKKNWIEWYVHQ